ncbi:MAG: UbiA family prenyltransferase [Prolixibacteraceae bacterium]|nr:UbiA family prenyltransferase [Prolixibacteraceae bacterium]
MRIIAAFIQSNIYISLAAVALTVATQVQLGMHPQWHPYLFIIFFATLFEYNLHRLITVLTNKEALKSEKHRWVNENIKAFYLMVFISIVGFGVVALLAKKEVLVTFTPIALITVLYSIPVSANPKHLLRLREIPYLKIFMIAAIWSASTILLPIVQSSETFSQTHIFAMLSERFFFILAITIPFDIRDLEADGQQELKTIPMLLGEKNSLKLSYFLLSVFLLSSAFHYAPEKEWMILWAMCLSGITTYFFLKMDYFKRMPFYHYGILDGTLLLQGIMVIIFGCFA